MSAKPHTLEEFYGKGDGQCLFDRCLASIDWHEHDKPPAGWATVTLVRWGKIGSREKTGLVCPKHTIGFVPRQTTLDLTGGK